MSQIAFRTTRTGGEISGGGWHAEFAGRDALEAWMAANRAGFLLAPGGTFDPTGVTPVMLTRDCVLGAS